MTFERTSRGIPFLRGGRGGPRIVVLPGVDAVFRPLDAGVRATRRAHQIARLLPPSSWTIIGYGAPEDGSLLDRTTRETERAIREIAEEPVILVGISFGGLVAQRLAALYPDLVSRLVLLVSAHRFSAEGLDRIARQQEQLAAGDVLGLVRDSVLLFRRPWLNALAGAALRLRGQRATRDLHAPADLIRAYHGLRPQDLEETSALLGQVSVPTLVIGGSADQYFGEAVFAETVQRIKGARLALFQREAHMLPLERPWAVAAEIRRFCREA